MGAIRRCGNWSMAGRIAQDPPRWSTPQLWAPQSEVGVSGADRFWMLMHRVWRLNLGRGLLLAARRQPEEVDRSEEIYNWEYLWRKLRLP